MLIIMLQEGMVMARALTTPVSVIAFYVVVFGAAAVLDYLRA